MKLFLIKKKVDFLSLSHLIVLVMTVFLIVLLCNRRDLFLYGENSFLFFFKILFFFIFYRRETIP
uniref:Zinc finger mynd domain-containing protein 11 n=1 Tax=Triatoma infestans TaxID=30076 RepID=A0A170TY71_TRIIF